MLPFFLLLLTLGTAAPRACAVGDIDTTVALPGDAPGAALRLRAGRLPSGRYLLRAQALRNDTVLRGSRWVLEHPVYRARVLDVDGDGVPEFCIGVTKPTRYDPAPRRRLFVFSARGGTVRPLWLGSRLGLPLEDFTVRPDSPPTLMTLERDRPAGRYAVGLWRWTRFGPAFLRYAVRGASLEHSRTLLSPLP
jgi:hypothetical protein